MAPADSKKDKNKINKIECKFDPLIFHKRNLQRTLPELLVPYFNISLQFT